MVESGNCFPQASKDSVSDPFSVLGSICLASMQLHCYPFYEALDSCVNYPFIFTVWVCT